MSLNSDPSLPTFVSYVDEAGHSKDPQRTYLCLAGLVARKAAWKTFDSEWRTACAEERVTLPFHMADFSAFNRQFRGWSEEQRIRLLGKLVAAIERAHAIPVGSVVSVKDYNAFQPALREKLRDPYFMALQPLTWNMAAAASMEIPPGPISMVYAYHPEHSRGRANCFGGFPKLLTVHHVRHPPIRRLEPDSQPG